MLFSSFIGVAFSGNLVATGSVRMVRCLGIIAGLVGFVGFGVVLCSFGVMLGGFFVMTVFHIVFCLIGMPSRVINLCQLGVFLVLW